MDINYLTNILNNNVVELTFVKKSDGRQRNMLCTTSIELLHSLIGRAELGFKDAKSYPRYNPRSYNNIIVWSLDSKGYRTIYCSSVVIKRIIPIDDYKNIILNNLNK